MPSLPDEPACLREYAGELAGRIEFLVNCGFKPPAITRGILFLMAFWSGPALLGFKKLCRSLGSAGLPDDFVFQVIDIDGVPGRLLTYLADCRQLGTCGSGETYWFREGGIFADTNCATGTDERIQRLLAESGGADRHPPDHHAPSIIDSAHGGPDPLQALTFIRLAGTSIPPLHQPAWQAADSAL